MVLNLILNASLLVALTTLYNLLIRVRKDGKVWIKILSGLLFGGIAVAGMMMPVHYAPGVIYDGRSIVLAMAGLFGGGTVAGVSIVVAGAYRAYLAGNGMWAGLATIISCAMVGLAFRRACGNRPSKLGIPALYALGISVHITMLTCQLLVMPWPAGVTAISRLWLPILLIFPVATVLMGVLLRGEDRRCEFEAALRASEDKFKHIFEYSSVAKSITQVSGEISVNQAFYEMLGYTQEELQNRKWQEITHPDDIELTQREVDALLSGEKDAARFTKRYLHKNGSVVWGDVSTSVRRDEAGKPLYFMTTLVDITERKLAEERIAKLNRLYRLLSDINQAIVRLSGEEALYQEVCRIVVEQGEFRMAWIGFVDEGTKKVKPVAWAGIVEDYLDKLAVSMHDEARSRGPSGMALREGQHEICNDIEHEEWMKPWREDAMRLGYRSAAVFPLRISGSVCGVFVLYASAPGFFNEEEIKLLDELAQDLSFAMEFAEREQQRKLVTEALYAISSRQKAILAAVPTIIMEVDNNKVYTWANRAGIEFFGEDVIGKEAAIYFEGEQDTYDVVQPLFNGAEDVIYVESWQRRRDGEKRLLAWRCRVLKDENGGVTGALSSARDITEREQAEEEIRRLNASLEQRVEERTRELRQAQEQLIRQEKLAVLGQLAGGVGHELRNPLSVINSAVYYLKLVQPEASDKIRQYHAMIEQEVHNAEKIINDLLDFARLGSVDRESVNILGLVKRVLECFPAPACVEVSLDLPEGLPKVFADPRQMEQVLGNLVVNAYQAMREGGGLTISAHQQMQMVAIIVKDSGVGISSENMQKLFEPLFTTKAKGIGLGLAVSKKLVEANGGRIEVSSEPGRGSTFMVYLPVDDR
jgi:PAS domain S-box-containing protein